MKPYRTLLLWIVIILVVLVGYQAIIGASASSNEIPFSKFMEEVKKKNIQKVTVRGHIYEFTTHSSTEKKRSVGIVGEKIDKFLRAQGVEVTYRPTERNSFWQQIIISWFPILLLVGLFFLFMRQLQAGGNRAINFSKVTPRTPNDLHKVTFNDVAGVDEAKEELEEVVQFLKDPKKFTRLGGRIPKGVLLMGSPGTGKTLLARAVAGEAGVPFFSISGSDFVEMFVGVGASRVRDLFEKGKRNAPCIIFIDEIDAVGRHRGAGLGGGHDEREQTLNQLLVEMDGFEANEGVILVAATNRPDVLDPALQRPGRFDRRVVVPLPDVGGRAQILKVHTKRTPLSNDVDLEVIARGTPGFSGADLENLVNEAALSAAREDREELHMDNFEASKDKVMMGRERRSMMLSDEEKERTAVHEAGHALVGLLLPHTDPLHKVTVIPRGRALGVTMTLPSEDRKDLFKEYLENSIAFAMGGRAADELIYGYKSSGASSDISRATSLARKMVCEWGMSERLGPLAFGEKDEQIFLGRELSRSRDYSEATAVAIDEEVHKLVMENYHLARKLLSEHMDELKAVAKALVEFETISGQDCKDILEGKDPFKDRDKSGSKASSALDADAKTEESPAKEEEAEEKSSDADTSSDTKGEGSWGADRLFGEPTGEGSK